MRVALYLYFPYVGLFFDDEGQSSIGRELRFNVVKKAHAKNRLHVLIDDKRIQKLTRMALEVEADTVFFHPHVARNPYFVDCNFFLAMRDAEKLIRQESGDEQGNPNDNPEGG